VAFCPGFQSKKVGNYAGGREHFWIGRAKSITVVIRSKDKYLSSFLAPNFLLENL
jgi:hypothetical protein